MKHTKICPKCGGNEIYRVGMRYHASQMALPRRLWHLWVQIGNDLATLNYSKKVRAN